MEKDNVITLEEFQQAQRAEAELAPVILLAQRRRERDVGRKIANALAQYGSMDNKHLKRKRDQNAD